MVRAADRAAVHPADTARQLLVPQIRCMPRCLPTALSNSWAGACNQIVHLSRSLKENKIIKKSRAELERSHDSCCSHDDEDEDDVETKGLFGGRFWRFLQEDFLFMANLVLLSNRRLLHTE